MLIMDKACAPSGLEVYESFLRPLAANSDEVSVVGGRGA